MSNVIEFAKASPHASGEAICAACRHTWAAVAPVGVVDLECPECGTERGHFKFPFTPPVSQVWECNCGCQLFNISPEGVFCPRCGVYQNFPKET